MTNSRLQWNMFGLFSIVTIVGLAVVGPNYGMSAGLRVSIGVVFAIGSVGSLVAFIKTWR